MTLGRSLYSLLPGLLFLALLAIRATAAPGPVAVVSAQYDRVKVLLDSYGIPSVNLPYRDLEKGEVYGRYRAIFFPCGLDKPIENYINIMLSGRSIQGVSLKEDYYAIDREKVYWHIRSFVEQGGSAYFSDYASDYSQGAFGDFSFFEGFPNMGMAGRVDLRLKGDLASFCRSGSHSLNLTHSGWIVLRGVRNARVLAEGSFETPAGRREGPIIVLMKRGDGELYYTSYHDGGAGDEMMRFLLFRVSYKYLQDRLEREAGTWEQDINCMITDSFLAGESVRSYTLSLPRGRSTVYLNSERGRFQVDLFDMKKQLVLSRESDEDTLLLNIKLPSGGDYTVKVYPATGKRFVPYALLAANGWRFLPHYRKVLYVLGAITLLFGLYGIMKALNPRKFSGRAR